MGGVSRRRILSIRPETFFCAVFETSVKSPRSHICTRVVKVYTTVEACQAVELSAFSYQPSARVVPGVTEVQAAARRGS